MIKEPRQRGGRPELFLLLNIGISPNLLIDEFGYSKGTVYSYNRKLKKAVKNIEIMFSQHMLTSRPKKPLLKKSVNKHMNNFPQKQAQTASDIDN